MDTETTQTKNINSIENVHRTLNE